MLAQIERMTAALAPPGSPEAAQALTKAKEAALAAYEKAWCQGPPFAYAFGLYHAKKHLTELGVLLPDLPPLDESKYEPMPEVEIDPPELASSASASSASVATRRSGSTSPLLFAERLFSSSATLHPAARPHSRSLS